MSSTLVIILSICIWYCNGYHSYFPVSTKIHQCCADPVIAFVNREFSGPCACQIMEQKWDRFRDWIEKAGGYIHPWIEFGYVSRYQDSQSLQREEQETPQQKRPKANPKAKYMNTGVRKNKVNDKKVNKKSNQNSKGQSSEEIYFKMHSHERGLFANINQKYRRKIKAKDVLFQVPFSVTFSQFIISKYIRNKHVSPNSMYRPKIMEELFPTPDYFMPDEFPDWNEFRRKAIRVHRIDTIRGWLALGLAWLKEYTHELLPWISLLPESSYLPISWNKFVREKFLLTGTKALDVVNQLERELATTQPYIEMLGLTEEKVREAFAMVSSRAFGMSLDKIGGAKRSPVIPCGIDFPNHNIFAESSLYYDNSFGENRFDFQGTMQNEDTIYELIESREFPGDKDIIREVDFASNYLWVGNEIKNKSEIFINYGKYHTSSSRMALFGFIDSVHPYDHYSVTLDLIKTDPNYRIKKEYFKTLWNATWSQQNKTINWDERVCFYKYEKQKTWNTLGRKPRQYQNVPTSKDTRGTEYYAPPINMEFYGQKTIKIHGNFLRFLRFAYLPTKHFDSFTISSILNDFEYDYLEAIIDPLIRVEINNVCRRLLNKFATTYYQDQLKLKLIEQERNGVLKELQLNANKNLSETARLTEILSGLDRHSVSLQYRIREKSFLDRCSYIDFEPTYKYLKTLKRRKNKNKKKGVDDDNGYSSFVRNGMTQLFNKLDLSQFIHFDPRQHDINNITIRNGNHSINVNHSHIKYNLSLDTSQIMIDYNQLLIQIQDLLSSIDDGDVDIDIDIFQTELDEDLWTDLINNAATSLIVDYYDNIDDDNNANELTDSEVIDDEELDDGDTIGDYEEDQQDIIQEEIITKPTVNKRDLVIGEIRKAKKHMVETIGWNSPKAGLNGGNNNIKGGNQQSTITFANADGEAIDFSALFGGTGSQITFNGNIQIQNGQIIMNGNNAINDLLSQFGINTNDNNIGNNAVIATQEEEQEEIPETVPFSQLMNSATVAVFSMDGNGNLVSVGNGLSGSLMNNNNLNNLAGLFHNKKKKKP